MGRRREIFFLLLLIFLGSVYDMVQRSLWLSFSPEDKLKCGEDILEQEENLSGTPGAVQLQREKPRKWGLTYKIGGELSISHLYGRGKILLFLLLIPPRKT